MREKAEEDFPAGSSPSLLATGVLLLVVGGVR